MYFSLEIVSTLYILNKFFHLLKIIKFCVLPQKKKKRHILRPYKKKCVFLNVFLDMFKTL